MTWNELRTKVEEMIAKGDITENDEVALDMEPDQAVKGVGVSTRFDGVKSLFLSSMEYDLDKLDWLMTCIRCDQVSIVHGTRQVCYKCDPVLWPQTKRCPICKGRGKHPSPANQAIIVCEDCNGTGDQK